MKTFQEVRYAIQFSNFSNDQLNSLSEAIRYARSELVKDVKRELTVGANVNFTSSRSGKNIHILLRVVCFSRAIIAPPDLIVKLVAR